MFYVKRRTRRVLVCAAAAVSIGIGSRATFAVTRDWVVGSGNFNLAGNWSGGAVPGVADVAKFGTLAVGPSYTVTFDLSLANTSLDFQANAVTWRSDTVSSRNYTLTGGAALSGGSLTLGAPASGTNVLTLASTTLSVQSSSLNVQANNDVNASGAISVGTTGTGGTLSVSGSGSTVIQGGAVPLTIGSASGGVGLLSLSSSGALQTGTAGITIAPTGTLSVNGGTLTANSDITIDGGRLERLTTTGFSLGVGRNLTAQNNGQFAVTGSFAAAGTNLLIQSGADMSTSGFLDIGNGTSGTLTVTGAGSSVTSGNSLSFWGGSGTTANVNFSNGAFGGFGNVSIATSSTASTAAFVTVDTGATMSLGALNLDTTANAAGGTFTVTGAGSSVTQTGALGIGNTGAGAAIGQLLVLNGAAFNNNGTTGTTVGSTGQIGVSGATFSTAGSLTVNTSNTAIGTAGKIVVGGAAGSLFTQSGNTAIAVGPASGSSNGTIQVTPGGTFNSGTGVTTVNARGLIDVAGGIYNANGNTNVNGGRIQISGGGAFNLAPSHGTTLQASATLTSSSSISVPSNHTLTLTGAGSLLNISGANLNAVQSGASVSALFGADINADAVDVDQGAAVTIDGTGSTLTSSAITVGHTGSTGSLTVTNGGSAQISGPVTIGGTTGSPTSTVSVTNSGVLNVSSGSALNINQTGSLTIDNGAMSLNADANIRGTFHVTSAFLSNFTWFSTGHTTNITSGGDMIIDKDGVLLGAGTTLNITGAGSTMQLPNNALEADAGFVLNISNGGQYSGHHLSFGGAGSGTALLSVAGSGSSITTIAGMNVSYGGNANVTFSDHSSANVLDMEIANNGVAGVAGNVALQGNSFFTINGGLFIGANGGAGSSATMTIDSISFVAVNGSSGLTLGSASGNSAVLNVNNAGQLNVIGAGMTTINPTGVMNINGGNVYLSSLNAAGGIINFNSGSLSVSGSVSVGINTALVNPTLTSNHGLDVGGNLLIDPLHTLTLNGGFLSAGSITNNGTLAFNSGRINITGAPGLTIGSGGGMGSTISLGAGQTLTSTFAPTIASTGLLVVNEGGTFSSGSFITNNGEVQLHGSAAQVTAGSNFNNNKLVTGNGRVIAVLNNSSTGEVRATLADRLVFTGSSAHSNSGKINLINGGTVEFSNAALSNQPGGLISGRGTLIAPSIANAGQMQLSGGFSDIFGTLAGSSGSKVIVSGGGTSTFYNNVTMSSGSEFRVSTGSTAVFFGSVNGTNFFTGSGTTIFEGGSSALGPLVMPAGNSVVESPANVSVDRFRLSNLEISGSAHVTPNGGEPGMSVINTLDITGGALDLADNDLVVNSGSYTTLRQLVIDGFGNPSAITSSTSDGSQILALFDNALIGAGDWQGVAIAANAVVGKYTYFGDANFDGQVTGDDYTIIDSNLNTTPATGVEWLSGDVNLDGFVTGDDYTTIDSNLGLGSGNPLSGATAVPEPGVLGCAMAMGLLWRRGRRTHG